MNPEIKLSESVRRTPYMAHAAAMSSDLVGWLEHLDGGPAILGRRRDLLAEICAEAADLERHALLLRGQAVAMEKDILTEALKYWKLDELQRAGDMHLAKSTRQQAIQRDIAYAPLRVAARTISEASLGLEVLLALANSGALSQESPELVSGLVRQWWTHCAEPVLGRVLDTSQARPAAA